MILVWAPSWCGAAQCLRSCSQLRDTQYRHGGGSALCCVRLFLPKQPPIAGLTSRRPTDSWTVAWDPEVVSHSLGRTKEAAAPKEIADRRVPEVSSQANGLQLWRAVCVRPRLLCMAECRNKTSCCNTPASKSHARHCKKR